MQLDDDLYRAFLEEMHALEDFRMAYAAEHPTTSLEREDPDVKRLIEALALFSARTRLAALKNIVASRRRIFRQFLPYLLTPLPAMGMLQATPTGRFAEPVILPCGAEIAITDERERVAICRTLRELRILPLVLGRMSALPTARGGVRILLPVTTNYPRNDDIGQLNLHVNYLNDFQASQRVIHALRRHLSRVTVTFEERVDETTKGVRCDFGFGLKAASGEGSEDVAHPVERERRFFHFPIAEHFFNIQIPAPPRNWTAFTLCFDIDPGWPKNLRLTKEAFQLFTTPIVNLQRGFAQPIQDDGSKESHPIRHPSPAGSFELHSILGVYRLAGDTMVPLRAASLGGGAGSYEVEDAPITGSSAKPVVAVHLPNDFENPATISVEAEWLQPWLSQAAEQNLVVTPYRHSFVGLDWSLAGDITPHREPEFVREADDFTHVLVLQNKTVLNHDDLVALLGVIGAWAGPFAPLRPLFGEVKVREVAVTGGGTSGMKLVYNIGFDNLEPTLEPLVEAFLAHLQATLDAWISDAPVEVRRLLTSSRATGGAGAGG